MAIETRTVGADTVMSVNGVDLIRIDARGVASLDRRVRVPQSLSVATTQLAVAVKAILEPNVWQCVPFGTTYQTAPALTVTLKACDALGVVDENRDVNTGVYRNVTTSSIEIYVPERAELRLTIVPNMTNIQQSILQVPE